MRIAFVSEHASPLATLGGVDAGGQNVHVAELAAGLVRAGHEVAVFTRRDDPRPPAEVLTAQGYRVVHIDAGPPAEVPKDDLWPLMPEFAARLGDALDDDAYDLVHAHFWMSGWATVQAARPRRIATALTFHALGAVKRRHLGADDPSPTDRLAVERNLASDVDRVIATCTDEIAELRTASAHPRHVSVVPCGVDVAQFTTAGDVLPGRVLAHRIVTLGRMVPRKGFDTVIDALTRLPDTELVLAGGAAGADPERERLCRLARQLGVSDRVRLLRQVPHAEVPALLRSADVVVTTPWYEPFGIVAVEAMACGIPVVASAVGGMLDTVQPGVTGLLVPPRDPAALADAVGSLLRQPTLRARYGLAGAARAREKYSWDRVAAGTVEAYRRTIGRRGRIEDDRLAAVARR
jgi:D-inositol-3-phosphate glycosyltransferase